ncbi:hypothetical protein B0H17DRAFT_1013604 [Mycena rosella]|uniref:Uncharacterized protein n=1 Tax=Mycena rosella TaxID=1033263 RepID=A0AAD7D9T0_MYCRO|nr:hypothetical protein B0H17DRAFT_1013604 [Mycena rosella]
MPDITILPANLATLVLESCLYGILLLLFISTIYFLATRRTLAGSSRTAKHHFTSLVFIGVASLFVVVTAHWTVVIYQAFFAFIHLGNAVAEDAFYADLSQVSEIIEVTLFFTSVLIGDALVIYRLWIIWGRNHYVVIFPMCSLAGVLVTAIGIIYEFTKWEPRLRGAPFYDESRPWTATGFILTLMTTLYSTTFIAFRILRVNKIRTSFESGLTSFLTILVESAGLQMIWLLFAAITQFATSDAEFIASDTLPAIIGISNLLIHARVGLGWSQDSAVPPSGRPPGKLNREDVV